MILKSHEPTMYHRYILAAEGRIELEKMDSNALFSYRSGLEGELKFYDFLKRCGGLKLWDVSLSNKGQVQYDFLVIYNGMIFHFDIKNFSGNYTYTDGQFISDQGYVHKEVLSQLKRAEYKLSERLNNSGYRILSRVIFINENFNLRGFNGDKSIVFYHQLNSIAEYLNVSYEPSNRDYEIAELLQELHSPAEYHRIHYYDFSAMKPGVRCPKCRKIGLKHERGKQYVKCSCGHKMSKSEYLKLAITEISILKNKPLTKKDLMKWTGIGNASSQKYLAMHCEKTGTYKDATYILK